MYDYILCFWYKLETLVMCNVHGHIIAKICLLQGGLTPVVGRSFQKNGPCVQNNAMTEIRKDLEILLKCVLRMSIHQYNRFERVSFNSSELEVHNLNVCLNEYSENYLLHSRSHCYLLHRRVAIPEFHGFTNSPRSPLETCHSLFEAVNKLHQITTHSFGHLLTFFYQGV